MKNIKHIGSILGLSVGLLALSACQEVIDVDLNDAEPNLVVEAFVDNSAGPHTVLLTQTTSFFTPESPKGITGASITVTDDTGESHPYTEVSDGLYSASFEGIPGRTYTIKILANGVTYTGSSLMKLPVTLDSLTFTPSGGFGGPPPDGPPRFLPFVHFGDPADEENFYRVREISEDSDRDGRIYTLDDVATNGNTVTFPLFANSQEAGKEITIELWHLDEVSFNYFDQLNDLVNSGPFNSGTPANPDNNLDNNALGFFAAVSKSGITTVVSP